MADIEKCTYAPKGWLCTKEKDHEGPCVAIEYDGTEICGAGNPSEIYVQRIKELEIELEQVCKQRDRLLAEKKYWRREAFTPDAK